ncbi:MAG: 50S ribosomal protein L15 [Flavobacteriales bacterium CG_4_9_14_0_2_um_filter_35_242]|nr:50S ribosomal protein L15 [Zetaproteobacteria bacterium]OIO09239.1 MAG: 50S ribosomal protein L15 [Flavobacteriaceae bacterium CG1_02_35_72]PJA06578.1 MAG: 50S ribosomal protein L15 [Flavobacteriales bacterium CG_4_10_14_0_2_um_filter_35_18]PJC58282.1 MAG: 50S ribosomal protein L15 [Flavobacteriales bacterium CG_4_9_14_0_2_um_filter_35_242]
MSLNNLTPAKGSVFAKGKRVGRGQGSGKGGTATKGNKGAKSRSGYAKKIGFEGGQMPIQRRLPKFGFKNINRIEYVGLNLDRIQDMVNEGKITDTLSFEILVENGVVGKNELVKILGRGVLTAKLNVTVHKFTATAKNAIEAVGGVAVTL